MMLATKNGIIINVIGLCVLSMLIVNSVRADNSSSLPPVQIMIKKLSDIENMITCSAIYQQDPKLKGAVDNYIKCVDKLIQDRLLNSKKLGFAVQIFVTPDDAKANDLVNSYNKSEKFSGLEKTKAISLSFIIPYPGGAKLNNGKYYKILIIDSEKELYSTEVDAGKILDKIKKHYPKSYEKPFITETPYMISP